MAYHADHYWEDCPEKDEWDVAPDGGRWGKHGHPPPPHLKGMDGAREFTSNAEAAEYMRTHYGKVEYTPDEVEALKHLDEVNAWLRSGEGPGRADGNPPAGPD